MTLVTYKAKKKNNKNFIVLSSMHDDASVDMKEDSYT